MTFVAIGPTDLFVSAWCQQDEHVKLWRWHWFTKGIEIRRGAHV